MTNPFRIVASAPLGVESAGAAEPVHLIGMALKSAFTPDSVLRQLTQAISALLRADRCVVVEGAGPTDPYFDLVKTAFARKAAVQAEGPGSSLCAPLFTEKHTEGAIIVERPADRPFQDPDLKFLATIADQAAFALHNVRLFDRATSDGLTGLPNRQRFTVELEDAIGSADEFSVLLVDIDHFKDKNEVYGRAVGDRALVELAELFRGRLTVAACVSRLGEDDFAAFFPGLTADLVRDFAEDLRKAVNDLVFDAAHEGIHLTLSAGVAGFRKGEMASSVFSRAADALAAAKRAGRNRVEVAK